MCVFVLLCGVELLLSFVSCNILVEMQLFCLSACEVGGLGSFTVIM